MVDERWQRRRCDDAAEWNGRLPDPERETSFLGTEPAHHGPPTGRLRSGAKRSRRNEGDHQSGEGGRVGRGDERAGTARQAGGQNGALPDPVGDDAPEEERRRETGAE